MKTTQALNFVPLLVCAALVACQAQTGPLTPPSARPAASIPPASVRLPKAGETPLAAEIRRVGDQDRLTLNLHGLGFKTQAFDILQLRYIRLTVQGPGIEGEIQGALVDLNDPSPVITLDGIPPGVNRIVTAQFYDDAQNPLSVAVAAGFYTSGSGGSLSLQLRRRFLPLAEILKGLLISRPDLVPKLNLDQLQAALDQRLFPGGVVGPVFATDPSLLKTDLMTAALIGANGNLANLGTPLTDSSYVKTTASFEITGIAGLVPGDRVLVRVGDPTSPLVESAGGTVSIDNILPGDWPITITLPYDDYYRVNPGGTHPALVQLQTTQNFTAGGSVSFSNLALDYAPPQIENVSTSRGPRGTEIVISGAHFHPRPEANAVIFENTSTSSQTPAEITENTPFELKLRVPEVPLSGDYLIKLNVGGQFAADQAFTVQNVIHVASDGDALADGSDWDQATTLQHALQNIGNGDQIWLKQGVYHPDAGDRTVSFVIDKSIDLIGGFAGDELSLLDRQPALHPVYLSGDLLDNENLITPASPAAVDLSPTGALRSDNSYHVVQVKTPLNAATTEASLQDLTIVGGNASDAQGSNTTYDPPGCDPDNIPPDDYCDVTEEPGPYQNGGGIDNAATLTLKHVTLRFNSAIGNGGAVSSADGELWTGVDAGNTSDDAPSFPVLAEYNRALGNGGAIYAKGTAKLFNTTLQQNQAAKGGGLATVSGNDFSFSDFRRLQILNNRASLDGGGIYSSSRFNLFHSVVSNNQAGRDGGGLLSLPYTNSEGSNELQQNVFEANQAVRNGGGVNAQSGLEFWRNILSTNVAGAQGGGLYRSATGTLNDGKFNVLVQNQAQQGGGLYLNYQNPWSASRLSNWTFYQNQAPAGSGIYYFGTNASGNADLQLRNMLFFNDVLTRGADASLILDHCLSNGTEAALATSDGSFIRPLLDSATLGGNLFSTDPQFSNAANPAGTDGWGKGDEGLRPLPGSPADGNGVYVAPNSGDQDPGGAAQLPANSSAIGAYVVTP